MSDRSTCRRLFILVLLCVASIAPASAGTMSLRWDAVSHPQLAGYRVYYGTAPGAYNQNANAGLTTQTTLSGLSDCTTHYAAVKAYDAEGVESPSYSNQISGWARPTISTASPAQIQRSSQASLTLAGANFQPGASVTFTDSQIAVTNVTVNNCHQLVVTVTVGAGASLGAGTVRVTNPDQVFGAATGLFTIGTDSSAPSISEVEAGAVGATTATVSWSTSEASSSQVFFRLQGQSSYQTTAVDSQMTSEHAVTLAGLTPESTYQYYVRSADASGNASNSTPVRTFTTLESSFTYLRFEAETGSLSAPVAAVSGAGGFRGGWISLPAGTPPADHHNPTGNARYGFNVPYSGNWHLWLRMYGPSAPSDGWLEEVDGEGLAYVFPSNLGVWEWTESRSYVLDEGLHELRLAGHEAQARVDRILITDDPNFTPTEHPGDDVTPPDAVGALTAVTANESVQLAWTDPSDDDAVRLVIRYRADGTFPVSPADGLPLVDEPVTQGSPGSFEHGDLTNGTQYSYSVFTIDASGNPSDRVSVRATPLGDPPGRVENLRRNDSL